MKKRDLVVFIVVLLLLSACMAPPEHVKESSIFKWIEKLIVKMNDSNKNREKQKKLLDELWDNNDFFGFYKDTSIAVTSFEEKKSDMFYSLDNNTFIIKEPLYITYINNDMYVSKDNDNWVVFKLNDRSSGNQEYFEADYKIISTLTDNEKQLNIKYSISFTQKNEFKTVKLKEKKSIVNLEKNMVLADKDKNNLTIDLKKVILFIPKDTLFSGRLKIEGNLLESNFENDLIRIKTLKDIYIYAKSKMLALSFDKKDWGVSILSFNISPNLHVKSPDGNKIQFDLSINLLYKGKF